MVLLFANGRLDDLLNHSVAALVDELREWDPEQLLAQSESEIGAYLAAKYSHRCPELRADKRYAGEATYSRRVVHNSFYRHFEVASLHVAIHVPYEGDRSLLLLNPHCSSTNPPIAQVGDSELVLIFEKKQLSTRDGRDAVEEVLQEIQQWIGWIRSMIDRHNATLLGKALAEIRRYKKELLEARSVITTLGLPTVFRETSPKVAVPVSRRRPAIVHWPEPNATLQRPEPTFGDADYEDAVRLIINSGRQLERSPSMARRLREVERRDLMLVALNSQFEGLAGGEVFNGAGKTDILLRVGNRNVFIAEFKIWRGSKALADGIDQLLSYLVWRDTKAALVLFIESANPTVSIARAVDVMTAHPNCLRVSTREFSDARRDFVFHSIVDQGRDIRVALLPFVISASSSDDCD